MRCLDWAQNKELNLDRWQWKRRTFQIVPIECTPMPYANRHHSQQFFPDIVCSCHTSLLGFLQTGILSSGPLHLPGMLFPQTSARLAFLSLSSLFQISSSQENVTGYPILNCHPHTPYHLALFCFFHSIYYYLAHYIVYFLLAVSTPFPQEQKIDILVHLQCLHI